MTTERERARRGTQRHRQAKKHRDRNKLLERVLIDVWRWTTFDGQNLDALRTILKRADPDAELTEALDRLVLPEAKP